MSLELPREPEAGDPIAARDIAGIIRYCRAITPRGGPGIRVSTLPSGTTISTAPQRGPAAEDRTERDLPLSFWPRIGYDESGAQTLYVRKGYASLAGGPIATVAPEVGDEFALALPESGDTLYVWLEWNKPEDPEDYAWSVECSTTPPQWPPGVVSGMDQIRLPLCVAAKENLAWRIAWMSHGDKLGLEFTPDDFRDGAQDVLVFDPLHKRYARVREVPPDGVATGVERLLRINTDGIVGKYGFSWVEDIGVPAGAAKGDLLYWDGAWQVLPAPGSGTKLLRCVAGNAPEWVDESLYRNP